MLENLKNMVENQVEGSLLHSVGTDLIDSVSDSEELKSHISNILNYGCVSGCVSSQIYYKDTQRFFDDHQDQIFDMYNNLKSEYGDFLKEVNSNNLSWLAYEETTRNIALDLGIEY